MRILLVITGLGVGGAEQMVTSLADCFQNNGHDVLLVSLTGTPQLTPVNRNVRVKALHMSRKPLGVLTALYKLRSYVRSFRPHVVNSHLVHANVLTRLLRLAVPMPRLISSAHNTSEEGRLRILAYRVTDWLADISTNVSNEAVEAFEHQGALRAGRMVTIHNGINTRVFEFDEEARCETRQRLNLNSTDDVILAAGRLSEQKDYPNLLNAFAFLMRRTLQAHLLIVGDGPLKGRLQRLSCELGLAQRVHFLGVRHDMRAFMSACDVVVLSSAWEGFGIVVAEAMSCRRVTVATDCGGVREVIGDAGFLVPPRDSNALANALEKALALDPAERKGLGVLGRQRVEMLYSLDAAVTKWLHIYQGEAPS